MKTPDRAEIARILSSLDDTDDIKKEKNPKKRNQKRRGALEAWMDTQTDFDLSQKAPLGMVTLREAILDDLDSYIEYEEDEDTPPEVARLKREHRV